MYLSNINDENAIFLFANRLTVANYKVCMI